MGNTKDTGDETEANVFQELLANGYSVSLPFGDNDGHDLVVDGGTKLHRIQCKTAWQNTEDTIRFNTRSYGLL